MWKEYLRDGLSPLCLIKTKLYATWDSGGLTAKDLNDWAALQAGGEVSYPYRLAGRKVRSYIQKKDDSLRLAQAGAAPPASALRRAVRQIGPPILAR